MNYRTSAYDQLTQLRNVDLTGEARCSCSSCGRETKYKCIKCEETVCVLCAPETPATNKEPSYKLMSKVGICEKCNENRTDTITTDEALREDIPDINETGNDGNASDPNTTYTQPRGSAKKPNHRKESNGRVSKSWSLSIFTRNITTKARRQRNLKHVIILKLKPIRTIPGLKRNMNYEIRATVHVNQVLAEVRM